jgi:Icc-related predicted phosphoesterase
MRLLLFSDLHCDTSAARILVQRASDVDVLIGAGDFGSVRHGVNTTIDVLKAVERPAVLVPGNNESLEELTAACKSWHGTRVLHGSKAEIQGVTFFGLGGGVPVTPFGPWSWDLSEEEASELLSGCPTGCVLISHSPPKGAVDRSAAGKSLGSTAVRDAIVRTHPVLVVCGHIHESAGKTEYIDQAPVINAGPEGILWETGNRVAKNK